MEESRLEHIESVDMNRILESGGRVRMVLTEAVTIGVDTPQELKEAEKLMDDDPAILAHYMTR
jgi:3-deoxy-manno-octulosonate cytidylyltransferase (CMP-KDO synthetase)